MKLLRRAHALEFAGRGWHVFPCTWVAAGTCSCGDPACRHPGKHPLTTNGYKDATNDPAIIRQWWAKNPLANIGIAVGPSKLVVLDIDPRNGGNGSLAEWRARLDALSTYVVRTGRGGVHYYFDRGHASVRTRQALRPGIDVIADTGYVIGAGSSGAEVPYECLKDSTPAPVPRWLLEAALQEARVESSDSDAWVIDALAGVPEGRRNDMCARLAGYWLAKNLPANVVERLLLHWAERCTPALPDNEVRRVVASIAARESAKSTVQIVEVSESLASFVERMKAQPSRPMLINNLILADSITLLHGQPRAGKTLALIEILLAISTGTPAFGLDKLFVPERLPVMYVTEEDPPVEVWKRVDEMCRGRELKSPPELFRLSVQRGLSIDDPLGQRSIIETVVRHGIRVIAFDPLRSLTVHADQGPAELVPVVNFLRRLQRETGCAVLLGHHDTKLPLRRDDAREPPHRISGGGLFGIAHSPISVQRMSGTPLTSVLWPSHFKFIADPPPIFYTLQIEEEGWRLMGIHKPTETPEEVQRRADDLVLRFVREHPGSSTNAVAKGMRRKKGDTIDGLRRLETKHEIESATTGRKKSWRVVLPSPANSSTGSVGSRTVPEPQPSGGSMVPPPKRREPRTDPSTIGQNRPGGCRPTIVGAESRKR